MTEPKRPPDEGEGGGMTGSTGSLTPPDAAEPFVPAERREIEDPQAGRRGTASMKRESTTVHPDRGAPESERHGEPTNLAERSSGYGSEHGLSPGDPAYRMEEHLPPRPPEPPPPSDSEDDGDEWVDEPDRF